MMRKISIITVSLNSSATIKKTIESVVSQKNICIEYLIIDGASTDGTLEIIKEYASKYSFIRWISEKDTGIYDAMNKGVLLATGDIIGILNSDDYYCSDDVLNTVYNCIEDNKIDSCYGNLVYSNKRNGKIYRYWKSGEFQNFKYGWMPPHPSFFVKKEIYQKYGLFRMDCGVNADYELMLRFLQINKITTVWINKLFVCMRMGGASNKNLKARYYSFINDRYSLLLNGFKFSTCTVLLKKIRKLKQFIDAILYREIK